MTRGQLYSNCNRLSRIVLSHRHALPILSTELVRPRDWHIESVTALSTFSAVRFVLTSESTTKQFMVVVIGWCIESIAVNKVLNSIATEETIQVKLTAKQKLEMAVQSSARVPRWAEFGLSQELRREQMNTCGDLSQRNL